MTSSPIDTTTHTYRITESPARINRAAVGQVASVGLSPASVHLILTADAAKVLAKHIGRGALEAKCEEAVEFDPQMWAGIALDLEAAAELGDLDAATTPADVATRPALLPYEPRHRDDGQVATVLAWTRYPNGYEPRHAKTANEIGANR